MRQRLENDSEGGVIAHAKGRQLPDGDREVHQNETASADTHPKTERFISIRRVGR
jgi:hypothetical protein